MILGTMLFIYRYDHSCVHVRKKWLKWVKITKEGHQSVFCVEKYE